MLRAIEKQLEEIVMGRKKFSFSWTFYSSASSPLYYEKGNRIQKCGKYEL